MIDIFFSLALYAGIFSSSGLGYDPGIGVAGIYEQRWNRVGMAIEGVLTNKKKVVADNGYTYSTGGFGRIHGTPWLLYAEAGVLYGGYNSRWKKAALWPVAGIGGEHWNLRYAFREQDTENETESLTGRVVCNLSRHNQLRVDVGIVKFNGSEGRQTGYTANILWGWEF